TIDGLDEVEIETIPVEPQIEIEADLVAAERFQIKPGDIRRSATTLLSGLQVGNLYEGQKVFDVVVWGVPEIRNNLTDIQQLLIDTPRGGHVQLEEVADIRISPTPIIIRRDAVSRFIDVGAIVSGRSLASAVFDVESSLQGVVFPLEYHAEVLSRSVELQAAQQRIVLAAVVALIGIFLLLQATFGSWRLASVVFLTLPVALVGGVLAVVLDGGVLSFGSIFGFLAILAIAVRNSAMMTRHFQHLEQDEGAEFGPELVLRGSRERLASILMTALVVGMILLPLVILGDVAGNEALRPLAVVILGGLVTTVFLDLFIRPALYLRYGSTMATERSRRAISTQPGLSTSTD
ncbi:MAG: efflux RND transporter permease subunit, partial [Anaerolineales bacterium]